MASKIQNRNMYVPVIPYKVDGVPDGFNELCVRTCYDDRRKHFYVSLHAGWKSPFGHGSIILGDGNPLTSPMWVIVKDSPRNSQKEIDRMHENLQQAANDIATYFDHRNFATLKSFVQGVALNGYQNTAHQAECINNSNPQNEETMSKSLQAADLIGKVIVVVNNDKIKYVIKSADGDKLTTDFCVEGRDPMPCPVPVDKVQTMVDAGTWKITDAAAATAAADTADTVEEVEDIQPDKTVTMEQPKAEPKKSEPNPKATFREKQAEPKAEPKAKGGKLSYETYQNKKGKTCAKVSGFAETDPAYVNASDLHGSASYEKSSDGSKAFYLVFGPRYVAAAKEVCDALNDGKTLADCQAIIDKATEDRHQQRAEAKAAREEHASQQPKAAANGYSPEAVAKILKDVMNGGKLPADIEEAMKKVA